MVKARAVRRAAAVAMMHAALQLMGRAECGYARVEMLQQKHDVNTSEVNEQTQCLDLILGMD